MRDAMPTIQGSLSTVSKNLVGKTKYKSRKDM